MAADAQPSVLEMLANRVATTPDKTLLVCDPQTRISYAEHWELSGRVYAWLKAAGVGAEDIVMYCLPRGAGLFACITGTLRAGAAFVLTEVENDPKRTAFIRRDCNCKRYVDEAAWAEILETEPIEGFEPVNLHSLCYVAYTSGTTGSPKGVLHEYGSLENAWKAARVDGVGIHRDTDTFLCMSPMNFVSTPIAYAYACAYGCALALMPYAYRESDEGFYRYLREARVSTGYLTPTFLRSHYPFEFPWRMCILSSEPADGLSIEGTKVYNCYASSESGCLIAVYPLSRAQTPAPVGKPDPETLEVFVLDDDGREVEPGKVGEICYRNPYVRGYLNMPERTCKLLRGGVFHSGDAGKVDENGNLILRGRLDEMFKIGGYRIEPDEVARAVQSTCGIKHLLIRGFSYKDVSTIIAFYIDDVELDEEDAHERLLKVLPEYMVPTNFVHLDAFPLLSTGKLDKLSLLPPEGSWDEFLKLEGADLARIGEGRTSEVFDMGTKALKLFKSSIPHRLVTAELKLAQAARDAGVSCPRAYEIVRRQTRYGIIFDKVRGNRLEALLAEELGADVRGGLISRFAAAVKDMHRIHVADGRLSDYKQDSLALCDELAPAFCSEPQARAIRTIFEAVPDGDTFVHGDCHSANALLAGEADTVSPDEGLVVGNGSPAGGNAAAPGGIAFVDFMLAGKGHPVFDLLCLYSHCVFLPAFAGGEVAVGAADAAPATALSAASSGSAGSIGGRAVYDAFLASYAPDLDEGERAELAEWIAGVHAARMCVSSVLIPGLFSDEVLACAKARALAFAERLSVRKDALDGSPEDSVLKKIGAR